MFHFYDFYSDKKLIISDLPQERVRKKFGFKYEILNSVKDKESIDIIASRILRSLPGYEIEKVFAAGKKVLSAEHRRILSETKKGKPRDEATRAKISATLKGRSSFQGKKHREESKRKIAESKYGNDHAKNRIWAFDPRGKKEVRVLSIRDIPVGFSKGRDYYSTEPGLYFFKEWIRSRK